ncbi:MAG: hypothetical protein WCW52_01145 [Elusimicrobiales bacterium]|jgi:hypothetical protein
MKNRTAVIISGLILCACAMRVLKAEDLAADSSASGAPFDGTRSYPSKAISASPAPEDKTRVENEFKKHITINDHGLPAERAALGAMLSRMMDSATAREMTLQFIKAGATAEISFEEMPNSVIATVAGKKTVSGALGYTITTDRPSVKLNKLFMQYDRDKGSRVLTHEILGHVLERKQAGALRDVYGYNENEEENSKLIGWLVQIELGDRPEEEVWEYARHPGDYGKLIKMRSAAYSLTLTGDEMKDPVPVYQERLAEADLELLQLRKDVEKGGEWEKQLDHFVRVHGMDPAAFGLLGEEMDGYLKDIPKRQKDLLEIKAALSEQITYFLSAEGRVLLDDLSKAADSDYFRQKDAAILKRRKQLETLLSAKMQAAPIRPHPVGRLTWDQFKELLEKDKKECPYGGIK